MNNKEKTKSKIVLYAILLAILLVVATILSLPLIKMLGNEAGRTAIKEYIDSMGMGGIFLMLGIQLLQIIIAVIPGEPIEVLAGVLYGSWGGFFICMAGILLGQAIIFFAVKKFGRPLVRLFFKEEEVTKYKFLNNEKKLETTLFILYFIPGTPKDILGYVAGLTKIDIGRFLFISVLARIPSVLSSTVAGSHIASGNWTMSILIFLVVGILGLAGILYGDEFIKRMNIKHKRR